MRRIVLIPLVAWACTSPEPINPEVEGPAEPVEAAEPTEAPVVRVDPELFAGDDETAVPAAPTVGTEPAITVEGGESLGLYADWAGVTAEAIAAHNEITLKSKLKIGQALKIPVEGAAADTFRQLRSDFIAGRLKRFLEKRGGLVRVTDHTVRRGDSLWKLAQRNGRLPLWVIQSYNPDVNLDKLAVGDTVKIPITAAQVSASR